MPIDPADVREYPAEAYWPQREKLASLASGLSARLSLVFDQLRAEGWEPHVVYGWRSHGAQEWLLRRGRSWTRWSRHNATDAAGKPAARAADVIDKRHGWESPEAAQFFARLGALAEAQGLTWGGRWSEPDVAHVELP